MTEFALAHAKGGTAQALAATCAGELERGGKGRYGLGFVYVTSPLAGSLGEITATLKARTGIERWVGTVGFGICATGVEYFGEPAVVALACGFDVGACHVQPTIAEAKAAANTPKPTFAPGIGIVHGDPRNAASVDIVTAIAERHGAYLVGGFTAADREFPQVAGGPVVDGGVSGVLVGGRLNVAVGLTQGCSPVGPTHAVTRAQGQILVTLNGRRAYDVLCEDVGIAEGVDPRRWLANVHAAVPVGGSDQADYLVRNLVGIDAAQGLVAIAETLDEGDRVMFVRRDRDSAEKDLKRMLSDLRGRLVGAPKAGLYYSCVARGPSLFDSGSHELNAIRSALGDIPIAGFFGNGEISNGRVYGYTGVLTVFS